MDVKFSSAIANSFCYVANTMIRVVLTLLGVVATASLALIVAGATVHDSPDFVYFFMKSGWEVATFSVPLLFVLVPLFIFRAIAEPYNTIEKSYSKLVWYIACSAFIFMAYGFFSYSYNPEKVRELASTPAPEGMLEKVVCDAHKVAGYKYLKYRPSDIVKELGCN